MFNTIWRLAALILLIVCISSARGAEEKLLCDFESDADLKLWEMKTGALSSEHVTHGQKSLKITPGEYMSTWHLPQNWTPFDSLEIDAFVDGDDPVGGSLLIADKAWQQKGSTYWNRHNGTFNLKPGANSISIPVNGLFRGEAGSRNGDIKTNIDPTSIIRFDIGFNAKGKVNAIYLDNMRLVKESRPAGILAFNFGPESQSVFPGFTPVSWNTIYGQNGLKAGLKHACGASNRARDDTFPTRLLQHFVWFEEEGNAFIADVPNGKCHVWMVFDDCGYWGGETCHHHKRTVSANGKEAFVDDRGADGPADYLFRFENVEPKPGDSIWDLYVKDLFKPAQFDADVTDGKLTIQCAADAPWSTKVAAIVVYPDAIKADAEKWLADVAARNKKEFETRAVFMGPKPKALEIPAEAKAKGYWLGFPSLEETVTFMDAPGKPDAKLQRAAAKGQRISMTFALRPLQDFDGEVKLSAADMSGPAGKIPAANLDLRYVHHLTQRGFNDIAYTIQPMSLRPVAGSGLKLTKDLTRQFWITIDVPPDAAAGVYSSQVSLSAGSLNVSVPITIEVLGIALDEPDFNMGFFGSWIPNEISAERKKTGWQELATLMKRNGMNSFSGGPNIQFSGLDESGKPKLDFAACDNYFRQLRAAGFTRPVYDYGGPGMVEGLHDGYTIGKTGHDWEKKTGKSFNELLKLVWTAVKEHSEKENWLPVYVGLLDEPRVVEGARENLELHKAYAEAVPFVRAGGSYSVFWDRSDPLETEIQNLFKTMQWSALNVHTQADFDKAKEFGRELHIYNQGLSRYSFGAYQWSEMRKGAKGRVQWHTLALHGYQFFDLDGREPDTAVINWGRKEIYPTLSCARCCEGANDFRFAVTLWNLAEKNKDNANAKAAEDFLEGVNKLIAPGQTKAPANFLDDKTAQDVARRDSTDRTRAAGLSDDETFRNTCIEFIRKLK